MRDLINFIEKNLNKQHLEAASAVVINAYRSGDKLTIRACSEAMGLSSDGELKKLFYNLIRKIHPDMLSSLMEDFQKAKSDSDYDRLIGLKKLLEMKNEARLLRANRFEYQHTETWAAPVADEYEGHFEDEDVFEDLSVDGGFLNAVRDVIFGNHDFHIEPADLGQLDGGLDLAFRELDNLDGIEYCRNIRILNISGNDVSNIWDLQELAGLEELYASGNAIRDIDILSGLHSLEIIDLSDNDIEDISVLRHMTALKFADLHGNPLQDLDIISELESEGVIILH
ncbi:MAG: leucine-rich repeat domain-containing protein [Spirochaetales bacterium]|uniref:Leucine-rich repeat domain-containing protein n=1 Tax=Candidatus Thalassospirochaeta sargassi TaxID=3119039 RepID=A0AAJ1IH44_9SPIO|nr:leucine-rich repeat domain-containing protein [Spirochaetales bacterium]